MLLTLALTSALICQQQDDVPLAIAAHVDQAFQRAFEDASDAGDEERIEKLVSESPAKAVFLFERYAHAWIDVKDEPSSADLTALSRASAIASAADAVLEAPGLLEVTESLERYDAIKKRRWHEAKKAEGDGDRALSQGGIAAALGHYTRAASAYEELGWITDLAVVESTLASCYHALAQYRAALQYDQKALSLSQSIGIPRNIAGSLDNVGVDHRRLGLYDTAIAFLEKALALFERTGDTEGVADMLNNLGDCYYELGGYEKAIEYLERSLQLADEQTLPRPRADALNNIGNCHMAREDYATAASYHEQALAIRQRIKAFSGVLDSLTNLGSCHHELGQLDKAIEYQQQALALAKQKNDVTDISNSLNNLANCYSSLGQDAKALELQEHALTLSRQVGSPQLIASTLVNVAVDQYRLGQDEQSLANFEASVAELDRVGRTTLPDRGRSQFLAKWATIPASVCEVVRRLSRTAGAGALARGFPLVESFFARTTLEGLQEKALAALESVDAGLSREREATLDRMVELRLTLGEVAANEEAAAGRASQLRSDLAIAEKTLDGLDQRLRQNNPKLRELVAPGVASLADVQKQALRDDEALLLYVLRGKESFVWVVTKERVALITLASVEILEAAYQRLLTSLELGSAALDAFVNASRELFQLLLAEAWPEVQSKQGLVIVPEAFLGLLPFEVLLTRDVDLEHQHDPAGLPYLLRDKAVRYAPSASLLVWFQDHANRGREWRKDLLLIGDPIYASERPASETLAERGLERFDPRQFRRLEKTREEVTRLALNVESEREVLERIHGLARSDHASGSRFDLYLGAAASKLTLEQDLCGYRIVHLAVHGFFDQQFPWFSGLVLSQSDSGAAEFLNLVEIASLRLDAEIVFLSACETAKGSVVGAEGVSNTARSFLLAGARSVVTTQWSVADEAAPIVAAAFYERLFRGMPAQQALREAKIALLEHRTGRHGPASRGAAPLIAAEDDHHFAHPRFWAPFVLWGG